MFQCRDVTQKWRDAQFEAITSEYAGLLGDDHLRAVVGEVSLSSQLELLERFVPARVDGRVISLDRHSRNAGKIPLAILTDAELDGYNVDPALGLSMTPAQKRHLKDPVSGARRPMTWWAMDRIKGRLNISIGSVLDPNNEGGYTDIYNRISDYELGHTHFHSVMLMHGKKADTKVAYHSLYPVVILPVFPDDKRYLSNPALFHEGCHVLQSELPPVLVEPDWVEVHERAAAIFDELEAYIEEHKAIEAWGLSDKLDNDFPGAVFSALTASGLSCRGLYTQISIYEKLMRDIATSLDTTHRITDSDIPDKYLELSHVIPLIKKRFAHLSAIYSSEVLK